MCEWRGEEKQGVCVCVSVSGVEATRPPPLDVGTQLKLLWVPTAEWPRNIQVSGVLVDGPLPSSLPPFSPSHLFMFPLPSSHFIPPVFPDSILTPTLIAVLVLNASAHARICFFSSSSWPCQIMVFSVCLLAWFWFWLFLLLFCKCLFCLQDS